MARYVVTAAIAGLILAVALKSRGADAPRLEVPTAETLPMTPDVDAVAVPGGRDVTIRYRFAGSVSRARLTYRLDGKQHTIRPVTDCQRSLADGAGLSDEGYVTVVTLNGFVPHGASDLHVVQENETGTQRIPVALN
jgi:hypothetical protein